MKPFKTAVSWVLTVVVGTYALLVLLEWPGLPLLGHSAIYIYWPVVISFSFLLLFGRSLWAPPTMVERFARAQKPDLSPEEVLYCRRVTQIWCGFFILNGATALGLALWGPLKAWALYTGCISYALMGVLFASEYLYRRKRFPAVSRS